VRDSFLLTKPFSHTALLSAKELAALSPRKGKRTLSIRVTLDQEIVDRIDEVAGSRGRQRFIREAILWRLDQEMPPFVTEIMRDIEELRKRVERLESLHEKEVLLGALNDVTLRRVCRDDLDRRLIAYFVRHRGATTPELAEVLLKDKSKRRTIHSRIEGLNSRAKELLGVPILAHEKGVVDGKRGAWWLINTEYIKR